MRVALTLAGAAACVYALVVALLFVLQRRFVFRPNRTRPELARIGMEGVHEVSIPTPDGMALLAWAMPPAGEDAFVVLYLHGNAGHIGHRAFRLPLFQRLGWGVLLLEYRGYGGNPGTPSEDGFLIDARAGLAALLAMGVPASRILLWGESLGTGLATQLGRDTAVAAILLESPYTSMTDNARRRFPFVPVGPLLKDHFNSLAAIGAAQAPVLVMHGALDRIVPVEMGKAIFAAAPEPKELWIRPEAGHVDLVQAGAIEAAAEFVARHHQLSGRLSDHGVPHLRAEPGPRA